MTDSVSTRDRIVEAAVACFARSGFHGASMQEICAEAGLSPGALYRHFPSKVAIIAAIAEADRTRHRAFFERMAETDDPVEALAGIGVDTLESLLASPQAGLDAEIMAEALRNPEIRAMCGQFSREARAAIVGALRRGQERGTVDASLDVETACQLVMAMGDGLLMHQALDPTLTAARYRPVLQLLLRRLFRPVAAAVLAWTLMQSSVAAPAASPSAPAVTVVRAVRGSIAETASITGTLVARDEVMVSPQDEGLALTEIRAEEGDRVTAGQVLARLSRDVLEASLAQNAAQAARADAAAAQGRSSIAEAQANRVQADLALARTKDLLAGGNAPRELFEQRQAAAAGAAARLALAENALKAAEADRQLAEAQRRELAVKLARTDIASPVAGVVSRRTARLGAVVSMAGDPLFRIIQDGVIELDADVPETLLAKLRAGQAATVDSASGARPGHVRLVSPEVGRTTRLGRVRVAVESSDGLAVGGFARATVEIARRDGVLAPLSAVLFQPDGAVVQVVRDGVVDTRRVTVGLRDATRAELTGLNEGEAVIAVSGTFVRGGDRVSASE